MLIPAPKMMRKALQTVNEYRIILGVLYFRNQFVWPNFSAPFEKESPRLQLLLVDVMYQFLFCFCFWFPPFIVSILSLCIQYVALQFLPRTN